MERDKSSSSFPQKPSALWRFREIVASFFGWLSQRRTPVKHQDVHTQRNLNKDRSARENVPKRTFRVVIDSLPPPPPPTSEEKSEKEKANRLKYLKIGLEVAGLIGLFWYACLTHGLLKQAQKSTKATQKAAHAASISADATSQQLIHWELSEIARLQIKARSVPPSRNQGVLKVVAEPNSDTISVNWTVKVSNLGPTIARGLNLSVDWSDVANTGGGFPPQLISRLSTISPHPSPFGAAIKVGDSYTFPTYLGAMFGLKKVLEHKNTSVIVMQVSYVDVFDQPQGIADCVYYRPEDKGFVQCPFLIREVQPKSH